MRSRHRYSTDRAVALLSVAVLSLLLLTGCRSESSGTDASKTAGGKLKVVTTVAPITSITANVVGDKADIVGLVPEGTNSHTFEPPPSTAAVLSKADVIFVNGLQLEDPTRELAEQNKKDGAEIVEIGTTVLPEADYIYDFSFPKEEGKPNPHLWTDPLYTIEYAAVVRDEMVRLDPGNAASYEANYAAFERKATALSDALKKDQKTIPGGERELLTYHDAYAYFARDYGWKVIGAIQPKNFEDPTPREVAALIDQIRAHKVPVIFGSEVFPSKVLAQIGKETGARYEATLRDDDLPGKPGDPEHSWFGLMRYDYQTMIRGLGGNPTTLPELDTRDVAPDKAAYPQ
jgi:ABC-type Zn uptake system ZnuABC Zn-binding protein ZnuA